MSCTMTSHKEIFLTMCDSQLQAAFEECGMDAEYYAKRACPVDTGRLRNSITHEVDGYGSGIKAVVGTNVEYAQYVEDGTYRMAARPYIKPSISDHIDHYKSVIKKYLHLNDPLKMVHRSSEEEHIWQHQVNGLRMTKKIKYGGWTMLQRQKENGFLALIKKLNLICSLIILLN